MFHDNMDVVQTGTSHLFAHQMSYAEPQIHRIPSTDVRKGQEPRKDMHLGQLTFKKVKHFFDLPG